MSPINLAIELGDALPRAAAAFALCLPAFAAAPAAARALTLPPGFEQTTVISGLNEPMDIEVAPGGRVFVAEKSGLIRTYDSLSDPTAHIFADLRTKVHNFSNRGLLSLAIDPDYPAEPYVYVFYVLDAPIGGTPPTWGTAGATNDGCFSEGDCLASVRVSKLRVDGRGRDRPGAGAGERLVPAVPVPPRRRDGLRRRRQPLRVRRRRRPLGDLGLRPAREPAQPVRRPAGQRSRDGAHAADGGGRPAARAGPAHQR